MSENEFPFNRILVVDDSEVDFFIANTLLKRHNPAVSLYYAMDVESALSMLRAFKPAEMPDLILTDLNFEKQKKQGLDFLREFSELYPLNNGPKVVVLSAYLGFNDREAITKACFAAEIIEKPFSVEKLQACLSYTFSGHSGNADNDPEF